MNLTPPPALSSPLLLPLPCAKSINGLAARHATTHIHFFMFPPKDDLCPQAKMADEQPHTGRRRQYSRQSPRVTSCGVTSSVTKELIPGRMTQSEPETTRTALAGGPCCSVLSLVAGAQLEAVD